MRKRSLILVLFIALPILMVSVVYAETIIKKSYQIEDNKAIPTASESVEIRPFNTENIDYYSCDYISFLYNNHPQYYVKIKCQVCNYSAYVEESEPWVIGNLESTCSDETEAYLYLSLWLDSLATEPAPYSEWIIFKDEKNKYYQQILIGHSYLSNYQTYAVFSTQTHGFLLKETGEKVDANLNMGYTFIDENLTNAGGNFIMYSDNTKERLSEQETRISILEEWKESIDSIIADILAKLGSIKKSAFKESSE